VRYTITFLALGASLMALACGDEASGVYCCTYESRHSACGGGDYTPWVTNQLTFDDLAEGWTPEEKCDQFSGSDVECGGSCCIYTEDRNNVLSTGPCPDGSL